MVSRPNHLYLRAPSVCIDPPSASHSAEPRWLLKCTASHFVVDQFGLPHTVFLTYQRDARRLFEYSAVSASLSNIGSFPSTSAAVGEFDKPSTTSASRFPQLYFPLPSLRSPCALALEPAWWSAFFTRIVCVMPAYSLSISYVPVSTPVNGGRSFTMMSISAPQLHVWRRPMLVSRAGRPVKPSLAGRIIL